MSGRVFCSRDKGRIDKTFMISRSWLMSLFESTAGKTKCIYEKWQRSQGCTRRLTKALPCPWEEIRKSGPRKEPISFQDSLLCPLRKKKITLSTYFDISDGSGFGKILLFLERTIKQNLQNNQRKAWGDASCSLFLKLLCCFEIEGFRLNLILCTRCCSWLALSLCLQRSMPPMFCHS